MLVFILLFLFIFAKFQALLAICELMRESSRSDSPSVLENIDPSKFLILSVGTGSSQMNNKLEVQDPTEWGLVKWFIGPAETTPLMDVFTSAMNDMVEFYMSVFYGNSGFKENYLRIQVH